MSFVYPVFLFAGLLLAVPVLIHLFNLRKYKTVLFPHTRFLRTIQLKSRKQSQIRYKWLLAARLLLLALLVLAFAQPFFNNKEANTTGSKLQIIYIDNSNSMSVQKGARSLLDIAREQAMRQVKATPPGSKFALLTNDAQGSFYAEPADKIYAKIDRLEPANASRTAEQVVAMANNIVRNAGIADADLFYYSDFQAYTFYKRPDAASLKHITFYGIPIQAPEPGNVYIDTAYLTLPVLQTGKTNNLIVHTIASGSAPKEPLVMQLAINGQVKSAATLDFADRTERMDTLTFSVNDASWQKIALTLNDAVVRFDDTMRISARSSANLSVLVLNEGQFNPYLQAAFRAYNGFRLNQVDATTTPTGWENYNLIIINGITTISETLGKAIDEALQRGQTICLFPGRTTNVDGINTGLKFTGDIRLESIDTASQAATTLQQGSTLVKDLFERIPENVQLPVANWHYRIAAGLTANQQSVLSFRNGDPMFARYTPSRGQFYICATSADLQSGNFPGSYFFAPFLFQMAVQSGSSNIYAITAGRQQPIYLPMQNNSERNTIHLYGNQLDVVPPQRPNGGGVDVFPDEVVQRPGFYTLAAPQQDSTLIAINGEKNESALKYTNLNSLKTDWKGDHIKWPDTTLGKNLKDPIANSFPLWKIAVMLALLMVLLETVLLIRLPKTQVG